MEDKATATQNGPVQDWGVVGLPSAVRLLTGLRFLVRLSTLLVVGLNVACGSTSATESDWLPEPTAQRSSAYTGPCDQYGAAALQWEVDHLHNAEGYDNGAGSGCWNDWCALFAAQAIRHGGKLVPDWLNQPAGTADAMMHNAMNAGAFIDWDGSCPCGAILFYKAHGNLTAGHVVLCNGDGTVSSSGWTGWPGASGEVCGYPGSTNESIEWMNQAEGIPPTGYVPYGGTAAGGAAGAGGSGGQAGAAGSADSGPPCDVWISPPGVVLEEDSLCAQKVGTQWNDATGMSGHSYWTTADEVAPDYATGLFWNLQFNEPGSYTVRAWIPAEAADPIGNTEYRVRSSGGQSDLVKTNQADAVGGWIELGTFSFAQGGDQWIRVGDYYEDEAGKGKRVYFDAIEVRVPGAAPLEAGVGGKSQDAAKTDVAVGGAGGHAGSGGGALQSFNKSDTDDSGCACRTAPPPSGKSEGLLLALLVLLSAALRRSTDDRDRF